MGKVLFPGYFPLMENAPCCSIEGWGGLSLEMAMAAYWKVKTWQVSFGFVYPSSTNLVTKTVNQTFSVTSPDYGIAVNREEQLVCDNGVRTWEFTIPEPPPDFFNALTNATFSITSCSWDFFSDYTELGELFFPFTTGQGSPDFILPITITIGDSTTVLYAGGFGTGEGEDPGSGSGSITAVEFWPYLD
jgi:hypothetical protein